MMFTTMRIAIIQPIIIMSQKKENLEHHLQLMAKAMQSAPPPELLLLPETPFIGWIAQKASQLAEPSCGEQAVIVNSLRAFASKHHVMVCSGFTERMGDRIFNSAVLIEKNGDIAYIHRKNNEVGKGQLVYTQGSQLAVVPTSIGRVGVIICADNFDSDIRKTMRKLRCELLLTPGAWVDEVGNNQTTEKNIASWHEHLIRTCKEVGCPVIGANGIGTLEPGAFGEGRMWGHSIAYQTPQTLIAEGETEKEQIIECLVKLSKEESKKK